MSRESVRVFLIQSCLPMINRLLDRQVSLVEYLTSVAAIFDNEVNVPADPALQKIDQGLLRLQARFCCNKRIKKIIAAFPRTFEVLGADQGSILRAFVEADRQTDISSLASAHQFYEFLFARWQRELPKLPYLLDVAACEFSMVKVCNMAEHSEKSLKTDQSGGPKPGIRRYRSVVPLRCAHDIRSIFEVGLGEVVPPKRDTLLVVTLPAGSCDARILEVAPVVFDLLVRLDDWVDPITLGAIDDLENLVSRLAAQEFIEMRI
jgi:hypothetical protein